MKKLVNLTLRALLKVYKTLLSPLLGDVCRFHPSCSEYAVEAVEKHGIFKGLLLALRRIIRCNPLCKGGIDPVPEPRQKGPENN